MKKLIILLLTMTVLVVFGKSYIMKIEMKDGTVRYVDTETVDQFGFERVDGVPDRPIEHYLTETLCDGGVWYHRDLGTPIDRAVKIVDRYIPGEGIAHTYTVTGLGGTKKPLTFTGHTLLRDGFVKIKITVPAQPTGYKHPEYGEIWIADEATYNTQVSASDQENSDMSHYDYINGFFDLNVVYYAPDYLDGKTICRKSQENIVVNLKSDIVDFRYDAIEKGGDYAAAVKAKSDYTFVSKVELATELFSDTVDLQKEISSKDFFESHPHHVLSMPERDSLVVNPEVNKEKLAIVYNAYDYEGNLINAVPRLTELSFAELLEGFVGGWNGIFVYNGFFSGSEEYHMRYSQSVTNDKTGRTYRIYNWGIYGKSLDIICDDIHYIDDEGRNRVYIPETIARISRDYGSDKTDTIYVASVDWWAKTYFDPSSYNAEKLPHSYYSSEGKSFILNTIYYPAYGKGQYYYSMDNTEYFIKQGEEPSFKPAIEIINPVCYTDMDDHSILTGSIETNRFAAAYAKIIVTDLSAESGVKFIVGNSSSIPSIKIDKSDNEFYFEKAYKLQTDLRGDLNIVAVLFDEQGQVLGSDSHAFTVPGEDWNKLGQAQFVDGWIAPAYGYGQEEAQWKVDLFQSKNDSTLYMINHPWGKEQDNVLNADNRNLTPNLASAAKLVFHIYDGHVFVAPQSSGVTMSEYGSEPFIVGNYEGYLQSQNPSLSIEEIVKAVENHNPELSVFEEGSVIIPEPLFAMDGEFGYRWRNGFPSKIVFPGNAGLPAVRQEVPRIKNPISENKNSAIRIIKNVPDLIPLAIPVQVLSRRHQ